LLKGPKKEGGKLSVLWGKGQKVRKCENSKRGRKTEACWMWLGCSGIMSEQKSGGICWDREGEGSERAASNPSF